jgi:hypothetical protein
MVGVVLLLLGVFLLLAVVGRIWIDRTPADSGTNDSVAANSPSQQHVIHGRSSEDGDSLV